MNGGRFETRTPGGDFYLVRLFLPEASSTSGARLFIHIFRYFKYLYAQVPPQFVANINNRVHILM